jgi:hypothetical protein
MSKEDVLIMKMQKDTHVGEMLTPKQWKLEALESN